MYKCHNSFYWNSHLLETKERKKERKKQGKEETRKETMKEIRIA